MKIIDGGYLSWVYGTKPSMHSSWTGGVRLEYGRKAKAIICLEGGNLWRNERFAAYKSKRKERTKEDPEKQKKRKHVMYFVKNYLAADPSLNTISVPGLEADDLVALFIMQVEKPLVTGVDKDLLQLPFDFTLSDKDGQEVTRESYAKKGPKSLKNCFSHPLDILLDLCLRGDRSDSIPRVLPRRAMKTAQKIFAHPRPFPDAKRRYGDQFVRNLELAVLPGPNCFDPITPREDLVWLVQSKKYWRQKIREDIQEKMDEALRIAHKFPIDEDPGW